MQKESDCASRQKVLQPMQESFENAANYPICRLKKKIPVVPFQDCIEYNQAGDKNEISTDGERIWQDKFDLGTGFLKKELWCLR